MLAGSASSSTLTGMEADRKAIVGISFSALRCHGLLHSLESWPPFLGGFPMYAKVSAHISPSSNDYIIKSVSCSSQNFLVSPWLL